MVGSPAHSGDTYRPATPATGFRTSSFYPLLLGSFAEACCRCLCLVASSGWGAGSRRPLPFLLSVAAGFAHLASTQRGRPNPSTKATGLHRPPQERKTLEESPQTCCFCCLSFCGGRAPPSSRWQVHSARGGAAAGATSGGDANQVRQRPNGFRGPFAFVLFRRELFGSPLLLSVCWRGELSAGSFCRLSPETQGVPR